VARRACSRLAAQDREAADRRNSHLGAAEVDHRVVVHSSADHYHLRMVVDHSLFAVVDIEVGRILRDICYNHRLDNSASTLEVVGEEHRRSWLKL